MRAVARLGRLGVAAVFVAGFVLAVAACGERVDRYLVYSGGTTGVYYPTSQVMAELANEANAGFQLDVRTSGGSTENARALGRGRADLAMIQNDIAAYARAGELNFEQPIPEIRGVAALYPEHVQIVSLASSNINSVQDLAGKTVAVGDAGSGTEQNALQILEAAGLSTEDLGGVERLGAGESVDYLVDGRVDAAFFTFGVGTAAIQDLASRRPIRMVPVDGEVRQTLLDQHEFYSAATIPAGSYQGVEQDVPTVAVTATLVAREDVPAEVVRGTLAAIFDNLESFQARHNRLEQVSLQSAHDNLSLPLHEGAEAFYSERLGGGQGEPTPE